MIKTRIGIIGQSGEISHGLAARAYEMGRLLASAGVLTFCGGRDGVMDAVARGVHEHGGLTIGILPGDDRAIANDYIDIPITTGLNLETRSIILVHTCDCLIMFAGGNGTLGELSAAYHNRKPVIIMRHTGGWSDRIQSVLVDGRYLDERRHTPITFADTPEEALRLALALAERTDSQAETQTG